MRQTTLSVPLEVKPQSCSRLSALIDELKIDQDDLSKASVPNFNNIYTKIPLLHFMSMSIFASSSYDPIFIIEANFDGGMGPFWAQFDAAMGEKVREMIRCCKRPRDETGDLYDRVTAPGSRVSLAAFLEARTQQPSVYFHGNRGLGRDRILQERELFRALQEEIDDPIRAGPNPYRLDSGIEAHRRLRLAMDVRFPWLDEPVPRRVSTRDSIMDYVRFFRFLVVALLALSLPGVMLAPLVSWQVYLIIMAAGVAIIARLYAKRKAVRGPAVVNRVKLALFEPRRVVLFLAGVAIYAVLAVAVLSGAILAVHAVRAVAFLFGLGPEPSLMQALLAAGRAVLLGLLSTVLTLPLLLYAVRYNELRDSSQDAPPVSERTLRDIARHEDWITQNHMGSIVLNKPGALRSVILRAGHYGLGLLLRVQPEARAGYLGSMRTVHFAHWAFLNNGSRLLFFSNFDHSWGSYLDDFIEKAHVGLTLAWGSSVGFPPTRMLLYDGASHGRQFKSWALASRAVSRFWYSAYPDLTVDQIERNHRIANGLRKRRISEEEAKAWMADL